MKTILLICTVLIINMVNAQERQLIGTEENKALNKLIRLKVEYDKAIYFKEKKGSDQNIDKAYKNYIEYIQQIKKEPAKSKILNYIDQIIKLDSDYLKKTVQFYSYFENGLGWIDRSQVISNLDYHRIVKYALFEKDMDQLPPLKNVPFLKVKKSEMPSASDIKGYSDSK